VVDCNSARWKPEIDIIVVCMHARLTINGILKNALKKSRRVTNLNSPTVIGGKEIWSHKITKCIYFVNALLLPKLPAKVRLPKPVLLVSLLCLKFNKMEHYDSCCSPTIIWFIKFRKLRQAGKVAHVRGRQLRSEF